MNRTKMQAIAAIAALFMVAGSAHAAPAAAFDAAMVEYERNHWPQAFRAFADLADQGHPQAARIAIMMWRQGQALYGQRFTASEAQRDLWAQFSACGGHCSAEAVAHSGC